MKFPKLEFEQSAYNKYQAVQDYGLKQIIYVITITDSGHFLLDVHNVDYNNTHVCLTYADVIKRANEINESLMMLRFNTIMHNCVV